MQDVFLLQNQDELYLAKSGEWLSGSDAKALYRSEYKDEAINQKVEFSVKQPQIRIKIIQAQLSADGLSLPSNSIASPNNGQNAPAEQACDNESSQAAIDLLAPEDNANFELSMTTSEPTRPQESNLSENVI